MSKHKNDDSGTVVKVFFCQCKGSVLFSSVNRYTAIDIAQSASAPHRLVRYVSALLNGGRNELPVASADFSCTVLYLTIVWSARQSSKSPVPMVMVLLMQSLSLSISVNGQTVEITKGKRCKKFQDWWWGGGVGEGLNRREIITVRGQTYVLRLTKY